MLRPWAGSEAGLPRLIVFPEVTWSSLHVPSQLLAVAVSSGCG